MRSGAASNKKSHICTFFISGFKFHTGLEMPLRIREFKKHENMSRQCIQSMPSSKVKKIKVMAQTINQFQTILFNNYGVFSDISHIQKVKIVFFTVFFSSFSCYAKNRQCQCKAHCIWMNRWWTSLCVDVSSTRGREWQ